MIEPEKFYRHLTKDGIDFFTGVPDSLLKDFVAYVADHTALHDHVTTANEGNAIALAAGHYLATGSYALVYMQNSGLGNAVNPLISLADAAVYSIPMLVLIGWRGEDRTDEPQHKTMGAVTLDLLKTIGVPYRILDDEYETMIHSATAYLTSAQAPYALIVRQGTFQPCQPKNGAAKSGELRREDALRVIVPLLNKDDVIVSTTGKTSRELFELRAARSQGHARDFLTVGSMGHASSIALGIALAKPLRRIWCFDGDGALLMHMGALATTGWLGPKNLMHVVFNNGAHDSVGGQPTAARAIDIPLIAKASGYAATYSAKTKEALTRLVKEMQSLDGPVLLDIKIQKGARSDLGRPTVTPKNNKEALMKFLKR